MRTLLGLAVAFLGIGLASAFAEDKKKADGKTTVEGIMVCSKCTLKETPKCGNAVKVKDGDKEVVYYISDKGNKETYHKAICAADSEQKVKVTGKLVEKNGKKTLEDAKVEVLK